MALFQVDFKSNARFLLAGDGGCYGVRLWWATTIVKNDVRIAGTLSSKKAKRIIRFFLLLPSRCSNQKTINRTQNSTLKSNIHYMPLNLIHFGYKLNYITIIRRQVFFSNSKQHSGLVVYRNVQLCVRLTREASICGASIDKTSNFEASMLS